jgi:hypothetical protein
MANQHTKGAEKALTEQQQSFVEHFLKWGNATAAAEQAGYSHPDIQAVRLLSKPHIKQFINRAIAARAMGFAPDMIEQLAKIAMDEQDVQPKDRIAAAIALLDRSGLPNGRQGTNINIDASQKTVNVTGQDVARLIAQTYMRGQTQLPPPAVGIPGRSNEEEEPGEEAEYEPVEPPVDNDED